jgi:hypothetical protein
MNAHHPLHLLSNSQSRGTTFHARLRHNTHRHRLTSTFALVGLPKASNVIPAANITTPTGSPSLMDGGTNICITNDLSSLIDAVPITLFPLLVATKGNALMLDDHCTMRGLLALPLTSGDYYYQHCYFCKNVTETIIFPKAIMASNNNLTKWMQIGCKGDQPGSNEFRGSSDTDTFTIALVKQDGLYYCPD